MDIFQSVILGIIQGVSEFLPISSSAHLVIIPYIFSWSYNGLEFDVALHFGTFLAVILFFKKDWLEIISNAFSKKTAGENLVYPKNLLWQIVVASIPAFIIGFFIEPIVEKYLHSPILLAINLIAFGVLLYLSEYLSSNNLKYINMKYRHSLFIGFAQCLALVPGVSRSGVTLIAAKLCGLSKERAARFSFILGTPAVFGAFVYSLISYKTIDFPIGFWLGTLTSAIFGFLAIKYLLEYLRRGGFAIFAVYRILLAVLVLGFCFFR